MKEKLNSLKRLQKGELEGVLIYKKLEKYAPLEKIMFESRSPQFIRPFINGFKVYLQTDE